MKFKITPLLILVTGLSFLFIRNIPLCFIMPLWSHGDEIGHMDYALKLNRGHFPGLTEYIEPSLFLLHKANYDNRYLTNHPRHNIQKLDDMGLAAYSYEANQPPFPYLIIALFRRILSSFNVSFLLQVKLLRLLSLFAFSLGLVLIYLGMKTAKISNPFYYYPLLFIPLLAQDMYFSINTDSFAFLGGCFVIMMMILLFKNPSSMKNWILLFLGVSIALWMKATNAFYFILWPILTVFLWNKKPNKKILLPSILFLLLAILLSSPWYVCNKIRFSGFFGYQFTGAPEVPYTPYALRPVSIATLIEFVFAFIGTLFRGELLWNGRYFDVLYGWPNYIFIIIFNLFIFLVGVISFFKYFDYSNRKISRFFIIGGIVSIFTFVFLHFTIAGIPFYHARYAFGGLCFIMFIYAAGWRRLLNSDALSLFVPAGWLLTYNLVLTSNLILKVI